jgi:hypothetical protein
LSSGEKIIITKGKKVLEYDSKDADRFEILKAALGRSGSLRAPTLRIGKKWIVGFNAELYESLFN